MKKYKENHLLFLYDFEFHFINNMSGKDLRICKNRQKMARDFRTADGTRMYCEIMSFIETVKRRAINIFQSIIYPFLDFRIVRTALYIFQIFVVFWFIINIRIDNFSGVTISYPKGRTSHLLSQYKSRRNR